MKALLIIVTVLFIAGCSKESSSDSAGIDPSVASTQAFDPSVRTNRLSREEFFRVIYSDYDRAGRKDLKWDEHARDFFWLLAQTASSDNHGSEAHSKLDELRSKLQNLRCEDPLVRYMILRHTKDSHRAGPQDTNEWTQTALELDESAYHQYWRFFSNMRAAQAHKSLSGSSNTTEVIALRNRASDRLVDLLRDPSLPAFVLYDAAYNFLINDLWGAPILRTNTYFRLEPLLLSGWGDTAEAHLIRGAFFVRYAWDARGGGWASTVSEDNWKLMKERLNIARESLEKSWAIKPMLDTALRMQWVELGDTRGRKEMERWFNNAMELDPGNYDARMNKLNWLHEKWHGSVKEMLNFGKECLSDTNGTAALTLYDVHLELAKYHRQSDRGSEAEYLKRPEVWNDIKLSFEKFFEAHPDEVSWRHNYALAAYRSEAWDDLRKQIKLMGPINYSYFGGKDAYEKMVRKAEQLGKEPVNL